MLKCQKNNWKVCSTSIMLMIILHCVIKHGLLHCLELSLSQNPSKAHHRSLVSNTHKTFMPISLDSSTYACTQELTFPMSSWCISSICYIRYYIGKTLDNSTNMYPTPHLCWLSQMSDFAIQKSLKIEQSMNLSRELRPFIIWPKCNGIGIPKKHLCDILTFLQ